MYDVPGAFGLVDTAMAWEDGAWHLSGNRNLCTLDPSRLTLLPLHRAVHLCPLSLHLLYSKLVNISSVVLSSMSHPSKLLNPKMGS